MTQFKTVFLVALTAVGLGGCGDLFRTVPDTLTASGPAATGANNQIGLFYEAHQSALAVAMEVAKSGTGNDLSGTQAKYRQMVIEGVGVVRANCSDFFKNRGENQKWIGFTRDIVAAGGTLATGVLAITGATTLALSIVSLSTAGIYSGLDVYQKNFLFGSDNIESVRTLILNSLSAHTDKVLSDSKPWTFQNAAGAILDNQEICKPASILALVREAIKAGKPDAKPANSETQPTPAPAATPTPAALVVAPTAAPAARAATAPQPSPPSPVSGGAKQFGITIRQ